METGPYAQRYSHRTVASPGHYRVLRDGEPLRKQNGMPFMLPFSPNTTRWRRAAIVELGIRLEHLG